MDDEWTTSEPSCKVATFACAALVDILAEHRGHRSSDTVSSRRCQPECGFMLLELTVIINHTTCSARGSRGRLPQRSTDPTTVAPTEASRKGAKGDPCRRLIDLLLQKFALSSAICSKELLFEEHCG